MNICKYCVTALEVDEKARQFTESRGSKGMKKREAKCFYMKAGPEKSDLSDGGGTFGRRPHALPKGKGVRQWNMSK